MSYTHRLGVRPRADDKQTVQQIDGHAVRRHNVGAAARAQQ
jgi:hypothetical protein